MKLHLHRYKLVEPYDETVVTMRFGFAFKRASVYHYRCFICGKRKTSVGTPEWYYTDEDGQERMEHVDPH
jgi:hypothetical protein